MEEKQEQSQSWKIVLVILTSCAVLMAVSYTMLIPFLPVYLTEELHVSPDNAKLWSGIIFSISFLISGIMAPIWGAIADKKSRKLMAVRAAILLAVSYGLGGIVQNEWQLFFMRAFQGFAAGVAQLSILLVQPIMPMYIEELSGHEGDIVLVTGIVFSVVGLSGVIAAPLWGIFSEKIGFRPALYSALFGAALFNMVQAVPDSLIGFSTWRFIGGLAFAGVFPMINSILTMSTPPESRGQIFGLSYTAQQVGNVIGPLAGGAIGMVMPLTWVIFLSGLVLLPIAIYLWMMRPAEETTTHGQEVDLNKHAE